MIKHKLGRTDLEVSKICLGTMTYGEQNTEAEAHEQLDFAIDQGINFIDTAEMYAVPSTKDNFGKTEQYIGSWIAARGRRDDFVLATKVTGPSSNMPYISDNLGFSRDRIKEAIDRSLKQLRTDYVDIYQLHWPERKTNFFGKRGYRHHPSDSWDDNFAEVITTLNDLIDAGKIRHWGLSNETPWGVMHTLHIADKQGLRGPVSIQNPYNLLNRTYEVGLAEVAMREQVPLLAYSPLAFGMLSGKYHTGSDTSASRLNVYEEMSRYKSELPYEATARYISVADKYDMTPAQLALAFINTRPWTGATIIGGTTIAQLRENLSSLDVQLSDEVLSAIDEVQEAIPNPAP